MANSCFGLYLAWALADHIGILKELMTCDANAGKCGVKVLGLTKLHFYKTHVVNSYGGFYSLGM